MYFRRRVFVPVTTEQGEAVAQHLRRRGLSPRLRERLAMVGGAARGQDVWTIAGWSGRSPRRVQFWLHRFLAGGIAALADAPRAGRPPQADAAYLAALDTAVETPPPALGLPFDVWTSGRLSAFLAETTGVRIAPGWLRVLLKRRRFACGRPKHTLQHLRDPDEVAACAAALAVVGEKGAGRPDAVRAPSSG